jgi:hypothetical protein
MIKNIKDRFLACDNEEVTIKIKNQIFKRFSFKTLQYLELENMSI